jgi:repressor LexA
VALVDDQEATIKKMYRRNGKIELRPANEKLETMMYNADRIRIQGVVVGVMRKYNGELS